ncbi:helix-turn-helix domain-containing protein [Desulfocurvus sp. DL9XJH121]
MDIKEMGHNLQAARVNKGLTVDDVVQRTKISRNNVLAMEAGDLTALPHPVYAKGFARNYAKLLGLDPEEYAQAMGREFLAEDNVAPALEEGEAVESMSREVVRGGKGKWIAIVLLLLAVAVGVALVYGNALLPKPAPKPAASSQPAPQEEPQAAHAEKKPLFPAPEAAPQPEAPADEAVPAAAPDEEPAAKPEAAMPAAPAAAAVEAKPEAPVAAPAEHHAALALAQDGRRHVAVSAAEACWILAQVDGGDDEGGVTVDIMLQPGQTKVLRYARTMTMKLGNAGGVHVELDGKPFAYEAQSGQVKTLVFPEQ